MTVRDWADDRPARPIVRHVEAPPDPGRALLQGGGRKPKLGIGWRVWLALTLTVAVVIAAYLALLASSLSTVPDPVAPPSPPAPQSLSDRLTAAAETSRYTERPALDAADAVANVQAVVRVSRVVNARERRREARQEARAAAVSNSGGGDSTANDALPADTANVSPYQPTTPSAVEAFLPEPWRSVADCETGGTFDPGIVDSSGTYFGLFQFTVSTWASVGGGGLPSEASPAEQLTRAELLYRRDGASPWPVCGAAL